MKYIISASIQALQVMPYRCTNSAPASEKKLAEVAGALGL